METAGDPSRVTEVPSHKVSEDIVISSEEYPGLTVFDLRIIEVAVLAGGVRGDDLGAADAGFRCDRPFLPPAVVRFRPAPRTVASGEWRRAAR